MEKYLEAGQVVKSAVLPVEVERSVPTEEAAYAESGLITLTGLCKCKSIRSVSMNRQKNTVLSICICIIGNLERIAKDVIGRCAISGNADKSGLIISTGCLSDGIHNHLVKLVNAIKGFFGLFGIKVGNVPLNICSHEPRLI